MPPWMPRPMSLAVAALAGAVIGLLESDRDRKSVWDQAAIPNQMESAGSGDESTGQTDRPATSNSI